MEELPIICPLKKKMRIYDPDEATLQTLRETNIELILDAPNEDLQSLVVASTTNEWVQKNIGAFSPDVKFRYIAVGNEVKPTDAAALYFSLQCKKFTMLRCLQTWIKLRFLHQLIHLCWEIRILLQLDLFELMQQLTLHQSSVSCDPKTIDLNYALLTAQATVNSGRVNTEIVVSEEGWPSAGETAATICNASTYYQNLVNQVNGGTPKRLGKPIETYLSACSMKMRRVRLKPNAISATSTLTSSPSIILVSANWRRESCRQVINVSKDS
ncbi:glucan endo-1,3-beta-glucosidase [Gossypium australe]|uniref:glucan endo-1,3-beta-D-glucosidase n=1 Tax=Gossypium australe TaxID=47621 RepID=A0A5B6UYC3_9ROSI|nr:glucan endo-1,3-beta-glucosidase [Gossypium australe]